MPDAELLRIVGPDAVTGDEVDLWVQDGVFVPPPGRARPDRVLRGFVSPGLVDAHCHVGYSARGAVDLAEAEEQARTDLATGVLAIRDCGSPLDTRPLVDRPDLPVLLRAGRHIARPKRYIRDLGVDLDDPADLPAEVARQVAYGDGWIKVVGDWIDRSLGDLAPLWPDDVLACAVAVAHDGGARVTAHVFGEDAIPGLLAAGIDCLEHGTGLTEESLAAVVDQGVHLVPTMINIANFPTFADAADRYPAYAKHMRDLHARSDATFASAFEAGVAVHAGTDAGGFVEHGRIVDEVLALNRVAPPRRVLAAAGREARDWLGLSTWEPGDSADLVLHPADPVAEPAVLRHPSLVMRSGRVVVGSP
ncbi:imidazolonepropionase-like amidohydrolase [Nakamurella flavida]|nr:amidohydrolase family protein [Nakamurella flavida]MDP9777125.1 imidazolonepropionase-like amidohydrolase [Nakamurella flavida]